MPGTTLFSSQLGDIPVSELGASLLNAATQSDAKTIIGVNGDGGGDVTSVNGKTGAVTLDASDVGALSDDTVVPAASTDTPVVAGTAAVGTSNNYARGDHVHPAQTTVSGNAGTASAWATGRTITLTGGVTGTSAAWTGSANLSFATTLATPTASVRGGVLQQTAIADLTADPSMADFNGLLAALRSAGVIASS